VGNGRWTAAAHGEQRVAGVEEGDGGGGLNSGRLEGKQASGMRREETGATLELEKRGRARAVPRQWRDGSGRTAGRPGTRARGPGRRS
jgi:hypothetical protein